MALSKMRYPIIAICASLVAIAMYFAGIFQSWQWKLADSLYTGHERAGDVVIVAIDNESISRIGRWPWPRSIHAEILSRLEEFDAKAIGYDVNFPESSNEQDDGELEKALLQTDNVVLPFEASLKTGADGQFVVEKELYPLPRFSKAGALGLSNMTLDSDGVLRRAPVAVETANGDEKLIFAAAVLDAAEELPSDLPDQVVINFAGPPKTFQTMSAADLLSGAVKRDAIQGKIVFVGATAPDLHDEVLTPTAKRSMMSGVETHANALSTIRSGGLAEEPWPLVVVSTIALALLAAYVAERSRRILHTILITAGALVAYLVSAFLLFEARIILNIFYPLLAFLIAAAMAILVRLSREKREKGQIRSTLSRYLSRQVVDFLIKHPEKLVLGGEKKEMTVLFSDLRGFTNLSEGLSAEDLVKVLNDYLSEMTVIVFEHGGVLDKYMGDAVMAFWNAPLDQPDHAEKAVLSAIAMRDRLREMNESGVFASGIRLKLGIGVNSGPMVVGNMGGRERFDYTVMGDTVNLGSRLESLNKEYGTEIIVSENTARALSTGILLRGLDIVAVKGKKEPVEIFEVVGRREGAPPDTLQFLDDFAAARALYKERRFSEAREKFAALIKNRPEDGPSKMYEKRSETFAASPPAEWDGVWVMTKK
jgi:adenylate cyclase